MSINYDFKLELTKLLNKYSIEDGSNTPDYLLAEYLIDCIHVFNKTVLDRDRFYKKL